MDTNGETNPKPSQIQLAKTSMDHGYPDGNRNDGKTITDKAEPHPTKREEIYQPMPKGNNQPTVAKNRHPKAPPKPRGTKAWPHASAQ